MIFALLAVILFGSAFFVVDEIKEVDSTPQSHVTKEEKQDTAPPSLLKIGFTNDWEYGPRKRLKHKLTGQAPVELLKVVNFFNNEYYPDIVIGGGDYIESSAIKKVAAKAQLADIDSVFKKVTAPRLYVLGNHDMRSLTKEEVREILEIPENHAVKDIGDWRVVVLDTNFNKEDDSDRAEKNYVAGYVSKAELTWLAGVLDTDRPVIVFSHHSPISVPRANNLTWVINIINENDVRAVLEEKGNVVAVISGHNPQSYYEERNGIHYVVVDTLVHEDALGSFATIDLEYLKSEKFADIIVEQHGAEFNQYSFDWYYGEKEKDLLPEIEPTSIQESENIMLLEEE